MADLLGGTTGQVLKKNTDADMDFVWAADAAGMTNPMTTTGDTIYSSSGSTPARLGIGTAGQILAVNSGATAPEWVAAPSSGGMTLLSTTTLTGASVTLSSIPATYNNLQMIIRNFRPATDNTWLRFRFNADSGANRHVTFSAATINGLNSDFNDTAVNIRGDQDNGGSQSLVLVNLYDYKNTNTWKFFEAKALTNNATTSANANYITASLGGYNQTTAISSIELFCNSGNFTSGTVLLYGVQ
jgi:hypothetical protein